MSVLTRIQNPEVRALDILPVSYSNQETDETNILTSPGDTTGNCIRWIKAVKKSVFFIFQIVEGNSL